MEQKNRRKSALKKISVLFSAFLISVAAFAVTVLAAPTVKKTDYEGKGKFEIVFSGRVQYKNVKVTVKDAAGKKQRVKIVEKDRNDIEFRIKNYKPGKSYTYKIKGIRRYGEKKYSTISGKVRIPKAAGGIPIKEVEYDAKDRKVNIKFDTVVQWKNPKMTISDGVKNYVIRIDEYDRNEIEVIVSKLKSGVRYSWKISGIRKKGASGYKTITGYLKT